MKLNEAQVAFLSAYLPKKASKAATTKSLVPQIRKRFLFTDGARMTNVEQKIFKHASLYIRYDYLRQQTSFVPEKTSLVKLFSAKNSPSEIYHFTTSGQAAILQALGLLMSLGQSSFQSPSTIYWETEQTFALLGFTQSKNPLVYWIDSSSFDVNCEWSIPQSVKWVVVDSTCWHVHGREFEVLRDRLKDYDVITVRSHVKLDMLGVEYASLGSIVLSARKLETIAELFYQAARLFGTTASPESIPPYLFEAKCLQLGQKRTQVFKKVHGMVQELMSELKVASPNIVTQFPPHGLYFYLALRSPSVDISQVQKKLKGLGQESRVEVRNVESFGFDFFGLQVFKPKREPEFDLCLRLSYGAGAVTKAQLRKLLLDVVGLVQG